MTGIGSLYFNRRKPLNWRDQWMWQVYGKPAFDLIREIRGHIVLKKEEADIFLEFESKYKTSIGRSIPLEQVEMRNRYYRDLQAVKHVVDPAEFMLSRA